MGRSLPSGTPERPTQYLPPRRRGRLVAVSFVLPLVMLAGVFGFYQLGHPEVASPAPVALMHAPIGAACQECHDSAYPYEVVDLRCERCHDPRVAGRYQPDAHAEWIPPSRQLASSNAPFTCASCHTEHRGRLAALQLADTRDCATCHGFTTLDAHPEFAAAGGTANDTRGLRFSHPRHIDEVRRTLGRGCETCHRSTRDLSGFEPVSFESQCAVCHLENGVLPAMTDPVAETLVTSPAGLPGAGDGYAIRRAGRGRIVVSGLVHRDPWILDNVRRLNRGFDADADRDERAVLEARVAALERARTSALPDAAISDLHQRLSTLRDGTPPDGAGASGTAGLDPRTRRLFERVSLEIERRESGEAAPVSLAATLAEERAIESALAAGRARLAIVSDRLNAPAVAPDVRAQRADAILSLVGSCLICHELQNGRDLAPVTTAVRRLPRARFTHAPHVSQVRCETCHQSNAASPGTTGLSMPGIETCRQCHATGQAPFGCAVCHTYHPPPEAGFGGGAFAGR